MSNTRREFLQSMSAGVAAGTFLRPCSNAFGLTLKGGGKKKPNIIFVLSDTHRYNAMSFTSEFVDIKTPNMERMKNEGVNFANCFSTYPLCSPYRAMMQTGKWAWETGHIDNHMDLQYRMDRSGPMEEKQRNATLGYMFTCAGYRTVHVGKWHQGFSENAQPAGYELSYVWPGEFHEELRLRRNGAPHTCPDLNDMLGDGSGIKYSGVPAQGKRPAYPTHPYKIIGETDQALGILKNHNFERGPLFMVLALQDPHSPFDYEPGPKWPVGKWDKVQFAETEYSAGRQPGKPNLPPHALDAYDPTAIRFYPYDERQEKHRELCWHYYASVTATDDQLGRVMQAVENLPPEERDNTIVVYTSDHGGMNGNLGAENGEKMYPNDASSHVPLLVWGPGLIKNSGRTCDALMSTIDLFPTLCGLAGLKEDMTLSKNPDARECLNYLDSLDGIDHSRNILDGTGPDPESVLVYHLSNCNNETPAKPIHRSIITKDYLYAVQSHWHRGNKIDGFKAWNNDSGEWMLFNRKKDPYERNNLVNNPEADPVREKLRAQLQGWLDKSERKEWVARFVQQSHYAPEWKDEQAGRSELNPFDLSQLLK